MARIRTYALDDNVTGSDYWIGTDGNNNSNTKNFSPNSVAKYLNENEVVDVSNSIRFRYDTIDSGKPRMEGTLSFATEIGAVVPINSLTTFILSKNTQSTKLVSDFLNILPGTKIILQKSDYINIFGIFKVISVTQIQLEPDFYNVVVEYISGYGSLEEDKDYVISLIDILQDLQEITDFGATTTNPITANSFIKIGGTSSQFLKANGSVDSTVYTTAQNLQQVTNLGASTTNSITANSFIKTGGGPNEILSADGDIIVAGNNISISGGIISSEGGDILTNPNTGISVLDTTIDTIYNTALDPALVMPAAVGGIPATTTVASLSSLNFVQIFNDILFPTQNPTYTIPVISLSSTVTSTREIGQTFSPVITLAGTKNDAGLFSQLIIKKSINGGTASTLTTSSIAITSATAIANQFGYTNPNNPNFSYTVLTTDSGLVIPTPTSGNSSSTVSYSGLGDYAAGLAKKNNKGFDDVRTPLVRNTAAPQAASTNFAPTSRTITGYYPYFYGKASTQKSAADIVSIIQSGIGFEKVMENAAGSLSMTFDATGEWPWFVTYSTYATKTTWFENALNNGSIGGVTDLFAAPTTLSVVSSDGYWTTTFKIYPSNKVTTLGTATIA
jgi:hypothetical protein